MTFNADWAQVQADIGDEIATREEPDYLMITGNPVDGFRFRGPFATADDVGEWAYGHNEEADWWVAPLNPPVDEKMNLLRSSSILGRSQAAGVRHHRNSAERYGGSDKG